MRPTIITDKEVASAETSVPAESSTRTISSMRSLPCMSPSRPMMGVATDALSRYAVRTQLTESSEVCKGVLDVRKRRRDERLQQRVRHAAEREHGEA
jgi:hypothetical protein